MQVIVDSSNLDIPIFTPLFFKNGKDMAPPINNSSTLSNKLSMSLILSIILVPPKHTFKFNYVLYKLIIKNKNVFIYLGKV
jgi:hypothetical protein